MPLITDRDILLCEPTVFVGGEAAATLMRNVMDGVVSGSTITSASSNFVALDIDFGHVASINDVPCEVLSRVSATQLSVSLPRALESDPVIEPTPGTGQRLKIPTFTRLIDLAEAWVLGALGIDPDDPLQPLGFDAIVNIEQIKHLVAMRVIHHAFAMGAAMNPTTTSIKDRAALYAEIFGETLRSTEAQLDLDGDGVADAVRRFDLVQFVRQ